MLRNVLEARTIPLDDYEALSEAIQRAFPKSRLERISELQAAVIHDKYPDAPQHYSDFLLRIGWGSLGDGNYAIYSTLFEPSEIFDEETALDLEGILFVGDDYSGWVLGFDTRHNWQLVEVGGALLKPTPIEHPSLASFIRERVTDRERSN